MSISSKFVSPLLVLSLAVVAGCATKASKVDASYVSPVHYQGFSCDQLSAEAERVSRRAQDLTGAQNKKATSDAVATGVALVVFWPAVFFIKGDNASTAELARLKGEMDAIEQSSIAKNCGIVFQRSEPKQ